MSRRLSDADYEAVTTTLGRLAGLVFDESRRAGLSTIMRDRLMATGAADVPSYLARLERPYGANERQRLLDLVTIQETHFFRIVPQMVALRDHVLPELVARSKLSGRPVTIWSAGCSTGEEAYTIAMLLRELMARIGPFEARVIGTDVSAAALDTARTGRYAGRTIDLARQGGLQPWFDVDDDGWWHVRPEVRELVQFRLHNLVTEPAPFDPATVDLILCRNVTIYFSRATTKTLMHRFYSTLCLGGSLLVGPAETLWQISDEYTLVQLGDAFVYRKEVRAPAPRASSRLTATERRRPLWPAQRRDPDPLSTPAPQPVGTATRSTRPAPAPAGGGRSRPVRPVRAPVPVRAEGAVASPSALDLFEAARRALAEGRYADAAERALAAADRADSDQLMLDAYVLRGRALTNLGDDPGGQAALRRAIFLDPYAGHAHFLLGSSLLATGDNPAAATAFMAAADSLGRVPDDAIDDLFDGRKVGELVELSRQLAQAALSAPARVPAGSEAVPS
jgi:chemotaxis protein methyltransferase CheR